MWYQGIWGRAVVGCNRWLSPNPQVPGGKCQVHGDISFNKEKMYSLKHNFCIHISLSDSFKEVTHESKEIVGHLCLGVYGAWGKHF